METIDTLIIGAGATGVTLLHELKGKNTICLEAHSLPGGCAGYFMREGRPFNAGATTLSGMAFSGPLKTFLDRHHLSVKLTKKDPGLFIHTNRGVLRRFSDNEEWIKEQERFFPDCEIRELWTKLHSLNKLAWDLTSASALWPPKSLADLSALAFIDTTKKIKALPLLLKSFSKVFLRGEYPAEYRLMLDELLMISTQSYAKDVPALIGIMGLCYLEDTWYPEGGMKKFWTDMTGPVKDHIRYRVRVEKIEKEKDGFRVSTSKGSFLAKTVISTIPVWETDKIAQGAFGKVPLETEGQGALTAYFLYDGGEIPPYHQIHANIPGASARSVFASASEGTLTLSTHIHLPCERQKEIWEKEFTDLVRRTFPQLLNLRLAGIGDPKTFQRFTGRESVGGLPHTLKRNFLTYPKHGTKWEGFYQSGDTTFPGQGIVGVMQGAMNLAQRIS
jgi:phytoene dehydrogenase-like protein